MLIGRSHYGPLRVRWLGTVLLLWAAGCQRPHSQPAAQPAPEARTAPLHATVIHTPDGAPRIPTGTVDEKGNPVTVACATCHATKPAVLQASFGKSLVLFHQGVIGSHGELACVACHNPADGYDSLHLADGKHVAYREVMTLCAQCHGTQFRDYQHGAHGGMTGFWDRTRGGRTRNNCIDCHDPHRPKYPVVAPVRGPNDRFLTGGGHD